MEQKKSTKFSLHGLNLVKVLVYESCKAAVGLNAAVNFFFVFTVRTTLWLPACSILA